MAQRRSPKFPLQRAVDALVCSLEGFELGENAIVMPYGDYRQHEQEFENINGRVTICGIPVYFDGLFPTGQIFLTSIQNAERIVPQRKIIQ